MPVRCEYCPAGDALQPGLDCVQTRRGGRVNRCHEHTARRARFLDRRLLLVLTRLEE